MLNAMLSLADTSWVVYRYYITADHFFCETGCFLFFLHGRLTDIRNTPKTIAVWTALKTSGSLREAFRKQTKSNRCLECVQLLGRAQHTHMRGGWDQQWSPHLLHLLHVSTFTRRAFLPQSHACLTPSFAFCFLCRPQERTPTLCYWSAMEHGGRWGPLTYRQKYKRIGHK